MSASESTTGGQVETSTSNIQRPTSNVQRRTSNVEHRTSNIERRTSNVERRTSNVERVRGYPNVAKSASDSTADTDLKSQISDLKSRTEPPCPPCPRRLGEGGCVGAPCYYLRDSCFFSTIWFWGSSQSSQPQMNTDGLRFGKRPPWIRVHLCSSVVQWV